MSVSRASNRRALPPRGRKARRAFTAALDLVDADESESFPAVDFRSFPYRVALANWPDEWRERWGHRANALEEEGLDWQEAESRAFFEVQDERRAESGVPPIPLSRPAP